MNCGLKDNTEGAREVRRTLQPLREVWMKVGLEKLDMHEGVTVKALLDSGAMGIFMDKNFVEEQGFKMEKLDRPVEVKNVDGTSNNGGRIEYEIQCNMYFEGHMERIRIDVCRLGRTKVILGMPWLVAHNLEINWEKGEVKMTRCPIMVHTEQGEEGGKEDQDSRTHSGGTSAKKVLEMEESIWKGGVGEDASTETLGSRH